MEHRVESVTDIEKFVNGRKELVAEVRKKIDELGIEYLYLQFVSVTGRIMGKASPRPLGVGGEEGLPARLRRHHEPLRQPARDYLGYGPEAAELIGIPEPETSCSSPGTSGWRVSGARCSVTARSASSQAPS